MNVLQKVINIILIRFRTVSRSMIQSLYNFPYKNIYLISKGLFTTIYKIICRGLIELLLLVKKIFHTITQIILLLRKTLFILLKRISIILIGCAYIIRTFMLCIVYFLSFIIINIVTILFFACKFFISLPYLSFVLANYLYTKILLSLSAKYYYIKNFNYAIQWEKLKKQIIDLPIIVYKKKINYLLHFLIIHYQNIVIKFIRYINYMYLKVYQTCKRYIYRIKNMFFTFIDFLKQIKIVICTISNYMLKFIISLKYKKVWIRLLKNFILLIILIFYKILILFYLCLREIYRFTLQIPNILSFVIHDIFKIKYLYYWSLNNIKKFVFICFVLLVVIAEYFMIYSNKGIFDKNNMYITNETPFMKIIQYGYYMINKETILKVKHLTEKIYIVKRNDLYDKLIEKNISPKDAKLVTNLLRKSVNFKSINSSAGILLSYTYLPSWEYNKLDKLTFVLNDKESLVIVNENDHYAVKITNERIIEYVLHRKVRIANSVNESILNEGIPRTIERIVTKSLSWGLDFVREVQNGDILDIVYTCNYNKYGKVLDCNKVLYVSFKSPDKVLSFYNYKNDYYYEDGKSVAKLLVKTPLDQVRLTSPFGLRLHPVLGYSIFHKGNDFAGKVGTPIYASGDGIIVKAYSSESYGLYITIQHNEHLRTAYAHLSKFAPNVKVGSKVKQFQVIGYIGSTGRATGPHLHYEVWIKNKPVNSLAMDTPSKYVLVGEEFRKFTEYKKLFDAALIRIPDKLGAVLNAQNNLPAMPE